MSRFLHNQLTNTELLKRQDCRYEGQIARVVEQLVFNKFKKVKEEPVPVIVFEDGWEWIPNLTARRGLVAAWGSETDEWIGRWVAIYLVPVKRVSKATGLERESLEKCAKPL